MDGRSSAAGGERERRDEPAGSSRPDTGAQNPVSGYTVLVTGFQSLSDPSKYRRVLRDRLRRELVSRTGETLRGESIVLDEQCSSARVTLSTVDALKAVSGTSITLQLSRESSPGSAMAVKLFIEPDVYQHCIARLSPMVMEVLQTQEALEYLAGRAGLLLQFSVEPGKSVAKGSMDDLVNFQRELRTSIAPAVATGGLVSGQNSTPAAGKSGSAHETASASTPGHPTSSRSFSLPEDDLQEPDDCGEDSHDTLLNGAEESTSIGFDTQAHSQDATTASTVTSASLEHRQPHVTGLQTSNVMPATEATSAATRRSGLPQEIDDSGLPQPTSPTKMYPTLPDQAKEDEYSVPRERSHVPDHQPPEDTRHRSDDFGRRSSSGEQPPGRSGSKSSTQYSVVNAVPARSRLADGSPQPSAAETSSSVGIMESQEIPIDNHAVDYLNSPNGKVFLQKSRADSTIVSFLPNGKGLLISAPNDRCIQAAKRHIQEKADEFLAQRMQQEQQGKSPETRIPGPNVDYGDVSAVSGNIRSQNAARAKTTHTSRNPLAGEDTPAAAASISDVSNKPNFGEPAHYQELAGAEEFLVFLLTDGDIITLVEERKCKVRLDSGKKCLRFSSTDHNVLGQLMDEVRNRVADVKMEKMEKIKIPPDLDENTLCRVIEQCRKAMEQSRVVCYREKQHVYLLSGSDEIRGQWRKQVEQSLQHAKIQPSHVAWPPDHRGRHSVAPSDQVHSRKPQVPDRPSPGHPPSLQGSSSATIPPLSHGKQHIYPNGVRLSILQGDITKQHVTAIVNAANVLLKPLGGLAYVIARAGGQSIEHECVTKLRQQRQSQLQPGDILTTKAGELPCQYVIHAVGPDYRQGGSSRHNEAVLQRAVQSTLQQAVSILRATSLCFPAISTGTYNMPVKSCAKTMVGTIHDFVSKLNPYPYVLKDIRIVLFDGHMVQPFEHAVEKVTKVSLVPVGASPEHSFSAVHATPAARSSTLPTSLGQPDEPMAGTSGSLSWQRSGICGLCSTTTTDPRRKLPCGHGLCGLCATKSAIMPGAQECKECKKPAGRGYKFPYSTMKFSVSATALAGHPHCGTIVITYDIPQGQQAAHHPQPGREYNSEHRKAFLPNNVRGQRLYGLLTKAFDLGLTFTIGYSESRKQHGAIIWNGIEHKTTLTPGPFGYPDPGYLDRLTAQLASRGIQ